MEISASNPLSFSYRSKELIFSHIGFSNSEGNWIVYHDGDINNYKKNNGNNKNQLLRSNQIGAAIRKIILFLSPPTITAKQRKLKGIMQNASKMYKTLMRGYLQEKSSTIGTFRRLIRKWLRQGWRQYRPTWREHIHVLGNHSLLLHTCPRTQNKLVDFSFVFSVLN